ncbi:MAG: hypothetical protein AAB506_01130 [Patescibacteria group bacterium]
MKKIISFTLFLVFCFLFLISPVHASYPQSYSDYQFQYSQYRLAYQNYQIAKSAFLTYKTLSTQNEALEKMRHTLLKRTDVLTAYLTLIWEKMAITESLDKETANAFQGIAQKEQAWLTDNQKKISAASNMADLNTAADEFTSRHSQISKEANLGITQILFAKTNLTYSKSGDFFGRVSETLSRLENLGEDTTFYRRGLSSAQAKADLYLDKKEAAGKETELIRTQKTLQEGLEYIRESTNNLKEILNTITGL